MRSRREEKRAISGRENLPIRGPKSPQNQVFANANLIEATTGLRRTASLLIEGTRIARVGTYEEVTRSIGTANHVDLDGRTVLPGINDAHVHLALAGAVMPPLAADLDVPSITQLQERLAQQARREGSGHWVKGFGFSAGLLEEGRLPSRRELDQAVPDRPAIALDNTGHLLVANSEAVAEGLLRTHAIEGAERPKFGESAHTSGVFKDGEQTFILRAMPPLSRLERKTALRSAIEQLHREGVTSVTDGALGPGGRDLFFGTWDETTLIALSEIMREGDHPMRVGCLLLFGSMGEVEPEDFVADAQREDWYELESRWFKIAGAKLFADGVLAARTACVNRPYIHGGRGRLTTAGATNADRRAGLEAIVGFAESSGWRLGIHVTGDRAIDYLLEAVRAARRRASHSSPAPPRHYLLHGPAIRPNQIEQLRDAGMGICVQPAMHTSVNATLETVIGQQQAQELWPFASLQRAGVPMSFSSDMPMTSPNWRQGIMAAVTRRRPDGVVAGQRERISGLEALHAYTVAGAWQDYEEHAKGALVPGMSADFCVLDGSISEVASMDWSALGVSRTYVGGVLVFDR